MSQISDRTAELFETSIVKLAKDKEVAIAFSGGIDSGLVAGLAMRHASKVTLYAAGIEGSPDIEAAKNTAEFLGGDLRTIILTDETILESMKSQIRIACIDSPLILAFETPLFNVLRACSEEVILGGHGADEQFAGYQRYVGMRAERLRDRMVQDLGKLCTQIKPYEEKIADHFGKTILYPYLDRDLSAMLKAAPIDEIRPPDTDVRKKILCDMAAGLGLGFLAERPKKAAQYGSGIMDAIRRVCKKRNTTYNALVAELVRERG